MVTFIVISTQTLVSVDGRYPVRTMSSKEATQVGIPTWDSANVPEGGRSMLTISATIFVGQNKGTHPELVKYFMYMARGVTGVPAGEEVVTLATRLAAAEAALFIVDLRIFRMRSAGAGCAESIFFFTQK